MTFSKGGYTPVKPFLPPQYRVVNVKTHSSGDRYVVEVRNAFTAWEPVNQGGYEVSFTSKKKAISWAKAATVPDEISREVVWP